MNASSTPRSRADPSRARLIRAYKHGWPRLAVGAMIRRALRRQLFAARAQGIARLRDELAAEPGGTLILANHSCWWDLYLAHLLNETIPVDGYGMMEHANLARFGFFRRIGAFSVDRTSPTGVRASLDYTCELLRGPNAGVWLFPQGRIVGNDVRPLDFRPGLRTLVRRAGRLRVVVAAFRYEFWQEERPEAFVRFGAPRWVDAAQAPTIVEDAEAWLTAELDVLREDVVAQRADRFSVLLEGHSSISERYARLLPNGRPGHIDRPRPGG